MGALNLSVGKASWLLACSRLSYSGEDEKEKGTRTVSGARKRKKEGRESLSPVSSRFIDVFALSQFSGPDYLGAWNRYLITNIGLVCHACLFYPNPIHYDTLWQRNGTLWKKSVLVAYCLSEAVSHNVIALSGWVYQKNPSQRTLANSTRYSPISAPFSFGTSSVVQRLSRIASNGLNVTRN